MQRLPAAFEYIRRVPTRAEIDLYDQYDPKAPRDRSSMWLARGHKREMYLVKATLIEPDLHPVFYVETPGGWVAFTEFDLIHDWTPILDWRPIALCTITYGYKVKVDDVECEVHVAVDKTRQQWDHYAWAYVPVDGVLKHFGTLWCQKSFEDILDYLVYRIIQGFREDLFREVNVTLVPPEKETA